MVLAAAGAVSLSLAKSLQGRSKQHLTCNSSSLSWHSGILEQEMLGDDPASTFAHSPQSMQ